MRNTPSIRVPASVRSIGPIVGSLLVTAIGGTALAAPLSYSPFDLARGELYLPEDVAAEDDEAATLVIPGAVGDCVVAIGGGAMISNGPGTCPALWAMPELKTFTATLTAAGTDHTVQFAPAVSPQSKSFSLSGETVTIPAGVPAMVAVALLRWEGSTTAPKPSAWEVVSIEGPTIPLGQPTATVAAAAGGRYQVFGFDPEADEFAVMSWQVLASAPAAAAAQPTPPLPPTQPAQPAQPTQPVGANRFTMSPVPSGDSPEGVEVDVDAALAAADITGFALADLPPGQPIPAELACPPRRLPQDDMTVVCVDATGPTLRYWQSPRTR